MEKRGKPTTAVRSDSTFDDNGVKGRCTMIEDVTLRKCMQFAVMTEELGAKYYARMAKQFAENEEVKKIFDRLSKDEEIHRKQFEMLLEKTEEDIGVGKNPEKTAYLRAMSISEFFSHHEGPLAGIDQVRNRDEALKKAFDFEKATLGFYRAVEDVLGKNDTLSEVIEAEKGHVSVLMKALMVDGSTFRNLQDNWP